MLLSAIWLLPVLGAVLIDLLPKRAARTTGIAVSLIDLALTIVAAVGLVPGHHGYQFAVDLPWVPQFGASYHLGVDGISIWLLVLNAFLTVIALLAGGSVPRPRGFVALLLLLEGAMAGLFLSADLLLFYVFWEAMLIPAYFLLWLWGEGPRPAYAALKFVIFTLVGSLLMLVGVIGEYVFAGAGQHTFDLTTLAAHPATEAIQFGLFVLFALAFAVKAPIFPFHSWLPTAYAAAPTPFLVVFAGVMGKTGVYAFLRLVVPLLPHPVLWWNWDAVMPVLAVAGIIWGALMALNQRDLKMVVAYSSVSHMGFILLGIFSLTEQGQQGALIQMVNHGIIIAALFLLVAWIERRTGSRDRSVLRDLAPRMPVLAGVFMVVTLASLGLPGLNSFVGEFMTLLGAWRQAPWEAVVGAIGLVLGPLYMLRIFQGAMYAPRGQDPLPGHPPRSYTDPVKLPDLARLEAGLMVPLIALMFLIGFYPALLTSVMTALGYPLPVPWS
ncbi:MAG: NADH-quinone oxidoreductase subunit M [Candidatus Dormiibacterota bacterium]